MTTSRRSTACRAIFSPERPRRWPVRSPRPTDWRPSPPTIRGSRRRRSSSRPSGPFSSSSRRGRERQPGMSRQVMADGLWQQHRTQIQGYIDAHKRNVLEDLAVADLTIIGAHHDQSYDTITVRVVAACADYDVDDGNGRVVRGNKQVSQWAEDWTFQRSGVGDHPGRGRHPHGQMPQLRRPARPRPGRNLQVLQGAGELRRLRLGAGPDRPAARVLSRPLPSARSRERWQAGVGGAAIAGAGRSGASTVVEVRRHRAVSRCRGTGRRPEGGWLAGCGGFGGASRPASTRRCGMSQLSIALVDGEDRDPVASCSTPTFRPGPARWDSSRRRRSSRAAGWRPASARRRPRAAPSGRDARGRVREAPAVGTGVAGADPREVVVGLRQLAVRGKREVSRLDDRLGEGQVGPHARLLAGRRRSPAASSAIGTVMLAFCLVLAIPAGHLRGAENGGAEDGRGRRLAARWRRIRRTRSRGPSSARWRRSGAAGRRRGGRRAGRARQIEGGGQPGGGGGPGHQGERLLAGRERRLGRGQRGLGPGDACCGASARCGPARSSAARVSAPGSCVHGWPPPAPARGRPWPPPRSDRRAC